MIVTLLTDFGHSDPYVGIMKGVLLGADPAVPLVDLSHGIAPGDVVGIGIHTGNALRGYEVGRAARAATGDSSRPTAWR